MGSEMCIRDSGDFLGTGKERNRTQERDGRDEQKQLSKVAVHANPFIRHWVPWNSALGALEPDMLTRLSENGPSNIWASGVG